MASTAMTKLSDAEIEALAAEVEAVSSKEKVHLRPVLRALLEIINNPADTTPLLHKWLSQVQANQGAVKIIASETTVSKITEVFNLGEEQWWNLVEDGLVEVPSILKRNLRDLEVALYDKESEATCRIAVDIMLVQCRKYLHDKHQAAETSATVADATNPSNPVVNKPAVNRKRRVKLFPEASLSIEMCDPFVPHRPMLVTGRADWAFGYGIDGNEGALLVAIEAKQASEFSKGKAQLLTYLAILRENRLRAKKTNITTQGFYSDGSQYAFLSITADGTINLSRSYNVGLQNELKIVFNFIITMMETAMKSTPNASLTKPGKLQDREVGQYDGEVWLKVFRHVEESMVVDSDDDMEDVIDLS